MTKQSKQFCRCSAEHLKQYQCYASALGAGVRVKENFEKIKVIKTKFTQKQNCSANCFAIQKKKTVLAVPPVLVPGHTLFIRVVHNLRISNAKVFHLVPQNCVSVLHGWCSAAVPHTADHTHKSARSEKVVMSGRLKQRHVEHILFPCARKASRETVCSMTTNHLENGQKLTDEGSRPVLHLVLDVASPTTSRNALGTCRQGLVHVRRTVLRNPKNSFGRQSVERSRQVAQKKYFAVVRKTTTPHCKLCSKLFRGTVPPNVARWQVYQTCGSVVVEQNHSVAGSRDRLLHEVSVHHVVGRVVARGPLDTPADRSVLSLLGLHCV